MLFWSLFLLHLTEMNPPHCRSYDVFRAKKDNGFQVGCQVMQRLASWFLAKLAALAPGTAGTAVLAPGTTFAPGTAALAHGTAGNAADPYDLWSDLLEIALWSNK
jgi:hypothetical protein